MSFGTARQPFSTVIPFEERNGAKSPSTAIVLLFGLPRRAKRISMLSRKPSEAGSERSRRPCALWFSQGEGGEAVCAM